MTPRIVRLSLAVFFSAVAFRTAAQPPPGAPNVAIPPARPNDPLVSIRLADDSVDQVLGLLTIHTGRAVLRPPQGLPAGQYSIDLRNIPRSEAILVLETMLAKNSIAITPLNDRVMNVTTVNLAKAEAPEMITGSTLDLPKSGRIATKVFHLEFMPVQQFIQSIAGIFNAQAQGVSVFTSANVAMITDTVATLQRVELLIKELDKPITPGLNSKFYTLKNGAKASDVVNRIRAAFGNTIQQQLGSSTTFSADDRTNQIILIADERLHPVFDELIEKLDIKADPNTRNEMISLKHAKAADVKAIINELVGGQQRQRSTAQSVRPGQPQLPNNPFPTQPNVLPGNPGAPGVIGGPGGAGGAPGGPGGPVIQLPQNQPPAISGLDGAQPSNEFSAMINVVEDPRSNSIIVSGTADDVRLIKELVAKIDTILAQVNIEVIIAEVTLNNTQRSGLQALNLTVGTDTAATGGTRGTHVTEFAGNVAGWAVTDGIVNPLAFKAALTDAGGRNSLKVLQAVTIMTAHGSPGNIIVGEKRPIVTGSSSQIGTGAGPVNNQTYQTTTIALDLKVTPFIGEDGSIQLEIDQKIEDVIGSTTINNDPVPIIGTRQAISNLNIFDGQMIVLGGLQRTKNTRDRTKIGFIYEIPVLSHLLGARTNIAERTELLLFIRPRVMRLENATPDTLKTIEALSNKDQIKQYLEDPSKPAKESVLEKIK